MNAEHRMNEVSNSPEWLHSNPLCAGKALTLLGMEEPGVGSWCPPQTQQRELLSLTPEERHCVGGAERKAQGIQGGTFNRFASCEMEGELYAS